MMMNINQILLLETRPYLHKYDCWQDETEKFLTHRGTFIERQQEAIQIIESTMTAHGKKDLLRYLSELARVEYGIRELEPWVRDHVVHALLSFVLGIYVNEKFLRPRSATVNDFQWKLAGMFHDVGYPAEIAKDILRPFTNKINDIGRIFDERCPEIRFKVVPVGLENLKNNRNSFDLIQKRLNEWGLRINAKEEHGQIVDSGNIDHGIVSSLAILYVIDLMCQKYNRKREYKKICAPGTNIDFNQKHFEEDVVSACAAIYVHNLPNRCFADAKIDRSKAPVAFLLKLSDCLQQWERPSRKNRTGFPADKFNVGIS